MSNLREFAQECLKSTRDQFADNNKVNVVGARYIVVLENNEVKQSDFDIILNSEGITYTFIFPKIYYTPMSNWYYSYLKPIIINESLEPIEGIQVIKDWTISYSGQSLLHTPGVVNVNFKNMKFDCDIFNSYFRIDDFPNFYPVILNLINCTSKIEAQYIFDTFNKNHSIQILRDNISRLESEIHIKNKIIEGYEDLINKISDIVNKNCK